MTENETYMLAVTGLYARISSLYIPTHNTALEKMVNTCCSLLNLESIMAMNNWELLCTFIGITAQTGNVIEISHIPPAVPWNKVPRNGFKRLVITDICLDSILEGKRIAILVDNIDGVHTQYDDAIKLLIGPQSLTEIFYPWGNYTFNPRYSGLSQIHNYQHKRTKKYITKKQNSKAQWWIPKLWPAKYKTKEKFNES